MAKLFDRDNMGPTIILAILLVFIIIVIITVFLSNFKFKKEIEGTMAVVLNEGDLVVNYVDGDEIVIKDNEEHRYGITIYNPSNSKIFYSLYFSQLSKNVRVKIQNKDGEVINEIDDFNQSNKLLNLNSIDALETLRYFIIIENKMGGKLTGKLKVENDSLSTESFADLILFNNEVGVPKTRLGVDIAATDEGLISTNDNEGTSYYFRGNVDYNYVKINDFYFRIVRINGDNSVRLVLDTILEQPVAYNSDSSKDNLGSLENSTIITFLNKWLNDNLASVKKYLSKGAYCTDNNFSYEINNINYSKSYERVYVDKAPTLFCNTNIYNGFIGLLSADEVVLAGGLPNTFNDKFYLYNEEIKEEYYTSSSSYLNLEKVSIIQVMPNGALGGGKLVTTPGYVRPVINISSMAKVKGTGLKSDPYIIVS